MRLDKFLKNSRLIKRRTVAKEACDKGRVKVNGRVAKAGTELAVGDRLELNLGNRSLEIEVVSLAEQVRKAEGASLYNLIAERFTDD